MAWGTSRAAFTTASLIALLVPACARRTEPLYVGIDASIPFDIPPQDYVWLEATAPPIDAGVSSPPTIAVQLISSHDGNPPNATFRVRIDGADGETMQVNSDVSGFVNAAVPPAFVPFTVTFAAAQWTALSILAVTSNLAGRVIVHPICPSAPPPQFGAPVSVRVVGTHSDSITFVSANNGGSYDGRGIDPLVVVQHPFAGPSLRVVAIESDRDANVRNGAVLSNVPWPTNGAPIEIDLPDPPVPLSAPAYLQLAAPASGILQSVASPSTDGAAFVAWPLDNPPFTSAVAGYIRCGSSISGAECSIESLTGDLAPTQLQLNAVYMLNGSRADVTLAAPPFSGAIALDVPGVDEASISGTTLDDARIQFVASDPFGSMDVTTDRISCPGYLLDSVPVWSLYSFGPPAMDAGTLPLLPSGISLADIGVQGTSGRLDLGGYWSDDPTPPWSVDFYDRASRPISFTLWSGLVSVPIALTGR